MNVQRSSDIWVPPALTTEDDLYTIYLEAIRFPRKKFGGRLVTDFGRSELMRVLTVTDAFLLLLLTFAGANAWITLTCLCALMLCIFNIPVGFTSLPTLLTKVYLDRLPMPFPDPSSLEIGSPESISIIADYLASGPIQQGSAFIARCQSERSKVERLLDRAREIEVRLVLRDSDDQVSLGELYAAELRKTREEIKRLNLDLNELVNREEIAQSKLEETETALKSLRALAEAAFQVRQITKEAPCSILADQADQARARLRSVCENLDSTRVVVHELQSHALARARAASEVQQLSHAS
jgi:hypothetical protein